MPQLTGKFFSAERTGFLTVSDLFLSVYADMTANGFDVINLSNPASSVGGMALSYNLVTERYTPTLPVPWAWKANVRIATATTHFPGEKLFINPADAQPVLINGIPQAQSYVTVTRTQDPVTGITYSSKYNASGTIVPTGLVVEVSDVVNGNIGFTGTDYPIFEGNLSISDPAGTFPLAPDLVDQTGTIFNYVGLLEESVATPGTAGTTVSDVGVCFRTGTPDYFSFTLECGGEIDPNNNIGLGSPHPSNQPWRVQFVVSGPQQALGSVAAPLQMAFDPSLGRVSIAKVTDSTGAVVDNVGSLGAWEPGGIFTQSDFRQGFVNRTQRVADQERTYPLSYILTIAERGFFLGIWEGNWSTQLANAGYPNDYASNFFNWVVVQRPVDRNTGRILLAGKSPVFALNGVGYNYYKAIVREADVLHPSGGPSLRLGTGKLIIQTKPPYQIFGGVDTDTNLTSNFLLEFEIGTSIWDIATNQLVGVVGSIFNETTAYLDDKPPQSAINQLDLANPTLNLTSSILTSDASLPTISSGYAGTALVNFNYIGPNQTPYRIYADRHSDGSHMLFNSQNQVSLTEDKTYLLTFPHNLTTPRFRYTEELDLMGTTSSDVVRTGQDVQFVTYGEWGPRTYRALPGSNVNNTGLRVAALFKPQGPKFKGVQTGAALGLVADNYNSVDAHWENCQDIGPLNGNLSAVSANTLAPGVIVGPLVASQPWTPTGIQFVGSAIPQFATVDPVHYTNLRYSITRNLSQINGVGIGIEPVTGILRLISGLANGVPGNVNNVGYIVDTIIPFTVTIQNDLLDNENSGLSSGQNSIDVYMLYKPM